MNSNRRVLLFVVYTFLIFLIISAVSFFNPSLRLPFQKANLISDVFRIPEDSIVSADTANYTPPIIVEEKPRFDFNNYHRAHAITDFSSDTSNTSLSRFHEKLYQLKTSRKGKLRIAYFGDSMIEGDLMTQTFRKLLQEYFGGVGVGFVPISSPVAGFRQSVHASTSGNWEEENFKTAKTNKLYLSGYLFHSGNAWVQMNDQTITDTATAVEKSLICGFANIPVTTMVNSSKFIVNAPALLNRVPLRNDSKHSIGFAIANDVLPVYGLSFESETGIFVDNFSFRGISGIEFARIDSSFLSAIAQNNPYDLIVFQYGVNVLFNPKDKNFQWYAKLMMPVVKKIRKNFPTTDFLLVSTADRAFRYDGEYRSAIGIDSLIKIQAMLAYETGSCFYNQFETMGGHNSIVDWAKGDPALARQDYVHPNHKGAELLGTYLFSALLRDYEKYARRQ